MSCVTLRGQGVPILANLQFGPVVNAAYSVAFRLSTQATSLSSSLLSAFQPALTSAEGRGDRAQMIRMSIQVCNFGTLLILIFTIPLILEMPNLLTLWLVDPPQYAAGICQWMLAMIIIDKMTAGPMLAINANGKIAIYELIQGPMFLLALPIIWILFQMGYNPVSLGIGLFISNLLYCLGRLAFAWQLIQFPIGRWLRRVAIPNALLIFTSTAGGLFILNFFEDGFARLLLTSAITAIITATAAWFWVLNYAEKSHIIQIWRSLSRKFTEPKKP